MLPPPRLSLVLPVFNEEETIPELARRLKEFLPQLGVTYEVLFIDDGSKDRSLALLKELAREEPRYKVLSFGRNFGHQIAITAGLDIAEGDAVVVMDADLQDPPEVVAEMFAQFEAGFDVVYGIRTKRHGESIFKKVTAAVYYRLLRKLLGFEVPLDAGDFRLMSRQVVIAMRSLRERHRFVRGMVAWIGFKQTKVYYERPARFAGETKYPLSKMLKFAIDGITSFSVVPVRIATYLAILSGLLAVGIGIWSISQKLLGAPVVTGWTTIMMLIAASSAAQLLVMGILGEYVGRTYEEVKKRPLYTVAERVNLDVPGSPAVIDAPPPESLSRP
ncbi:MAG: glycosyltransferase [Sorangiineae bacterium NIC37A_2]|jgi:glycosyltransferase involved in cell wall biosynthesis|nr:MAG: glycosyltransferase [Sorangiineae bacterium NIC37A_2]